jgi:tRNA G18 (ribose-2'-O)-methylase SpoU
MGTPVADPADVRIAPYRDVGDHAALLARGVFVAEGRLVVQRLIADRRFHIESVVVTPAAYQQLSPWLECVTTAVLICAPDVLSAVTGFNFHRGCLALARRPCVEDSLASLLPAERLLVLEGVGNPDNIGGLFRAALALGAGGVVLDERCGDPFYRKAVRTSMGATLRVPFTRLPVIEAVAKLRAAGFQIVGLTPAPDAIDLRDLVPASKVAMLLGAEGGGLSADALDCSDVLARIPVDAAADSLNVTVAAAIALYQLGSWASRGGR